MKGGAAAAVALLLVGTGRLELPARFEQGRSSSADTGNETRMPERLQHTVEIPELRATNRTSTVPAGANLQDALDHAKPGDLITLEPGATYHGPFRLPRKEGDAWITIAASSDGHLSRPGVRVTTAQGARMPKLVADTGSVISTEPGAHHYRLVGLNIGPADGVFLRDVVQFGSDERSVAELPHHLIVERCYVHGDARKGSRRGIALNSRDTAIVDSYISDFKEVAADSQAIAGWNGAGPFKIANNYLEAAGENIMFGGADPAISEMVPADIEIVRNHLTKPLRWKMGDPHYEGTEWAVKNLFELKNARRVDVNGNLLEYNWPHAQNGFAVLFTVRNQDGGAPWSVVEDVAFVNNIVRHAAAGINILGHDDNHPSKQTSRLLIRNNLFLDIGGTWGQGRLFQLLDGTRDVVIDHNTALQTNGIVFGGDHEPHAGFVFQNNITLHNSQGIIGSGTGAGSATLARYFPAAIVRRNVIVGGSAGEYPADNFFPRSIEELGAIARGTDDFHLTISTKYARSATDGRDPGADLETITKAAGGGGSTKAGNEAAIGFFAAQLLWPGSWFANAYVFWGALAVLAYIYLGYPLIARLRAAVRPKTRIRAPIEPTVTVIVVAYNEADRIDARIENLLSLDYPDDCLEIIIGSDGSTDDTVALAQRHMARGVKVVPFRERRGKPAVLNALVPSARGQIIVFADARQRFDRDAIRALVANFADPAAGAVSGELILATVPSAATASQGSAFYWRYEKFIRATEGRSDSTVGATGAIYAIRRELFEPIPDDTVLDDVLIPLRIMRRGYRVLFEPAARAFDLPSSTGRQEFIRKVRTIAGTFQLFAREVWLFNPHQNRLWFETMSHKALRLMLPSMHAALLASNLALLHAWGPYDWMIAAQVVFYAAALAGYIQQPSRRRLVLFSVPYTICLLNWATVVGFVRFASQRQRVTWERLPAPAQGTRSPSRLQSAQRY